MQQPLSIAQIVAVLSGAGVSPNSKGEYKIKAQLLGIREENEASVSIDPTEGIWFDYGTGKGGHLSDFDASYGSEPAPRAATRVEQPAPMFKIVSVKPVSASQTLVKMCAARGIRQETAERFCNAVYYTRNGEKTAKGYPYFALGFKNANGGYEIRSSSATLPKFTIGTKSVTWIKATNQPKHLYVVEGFFDFLSLYQTVKEKGGNPDVQDYLILNGSAMVGSIYANELTGYGTVQCFSDNDNGGNVVFDTLKSLHPLVNDRRSEYAGFKDYNENYVSLLGRSYSQEKIYPHDDGNALFKVIVKYRISKDGEEIDRTMWYFTRDRESDRKADKPKNEETYEQLLARFKGLQEQMQRVDKGIESERIEYAQLFCMTLVEPSDHEGRYGKYITTLKPLPK